MYRDASEKELLQSPYADVVQMDSGNPFPFSTSDRIFHQNEKRGRSQWHIPWSDLMMTMFILFAVMYVYASSKNEIVPPSSSAAVSSIAKIYDLSKDAFQEDGMKRLASVELIPDKAVKILLTSDLLFDTAKADLKPGAMDALTQIAGILREVPHQVNLTGHTDNIPIHSQYFPSNWELSTARASAVARYLIEKMHIPAERFCVSGYADMRPLRPNDSDEDRAVNRRVEIMITKAKTVEDLHMFQTVSESRS